MFTPPSVNQISSAYLGNPQPLAQKVEKDKQQHGGIPQDLRQLLALNDITEGRNAVGIQQALQAPAQMPTVAQSLQERARQAIQAQMMQQAQQQQAKNGQPMIMPPNVPRPPMQAQGIDSLQTNVGEEYAHGGIIGFSKPTEENNNSLVNDLDKKEPVRLPGEDFSTFRRRIFDAELQAQQDRNTTEEKNRELERQRLLADRGEGDMIPPSPFFNRAPLTLTSTQRPAASVPSPADPNFRRQPDPRMTGTPAVSPSVPLITSESRQPSSNVNVSAAKDNAPMPAGERPASGLDAYLATPERNLTRTMNVDPDAVIKSGIDMYSKYVGSPSTVGIDRMIDELNRRKEKLEGEKPKPGFESLMDYLENVANAGGRHWYESGTKGAALQKANQKAREEQINALIEKGIDLSQKKEDVAYGVKKEGFGVGLKEMQDAVKRKYDSAIALTNNDMEREKLKQQRELELRKISAMHVNPALQLAAALQNAKTPEQREFINQGIAGVYGNRSTGTDAAILRDYETAVTKAKDAYKDDMRKFGTPAEKAALKADIERDINTINARYSKYGITGQGAGASTTTAVPLPPDARTNPDKLVVGTIYQTAQGPGKWNGKGFEPQ